jgi:hypothetical protein
MIMFSAAEDIPVNERAHALWERTSLVLVVLLGLNLGLQEHLPTFFAHHNEHRAILPLCIQTEHAPRSAARIPYAFVTARTSRFFRVTCPVPRSRQLPCSSSSYTFTLQLVSTSIASFLVPYERAKQKDCSAAQSGTGVRGMQRCSTPKTGMR